MIFGQLQVGQLYQKVDKKGQENVKNRVFSQAPPREMSKYRYIVYGSNGN